MEPISLEDALLIVASRGNIPREDDWELMEAAAKLAETVVAVRAAVLQMESAEDAGGQRWWDGFLAAKSAMK